jgi:hypothetical protein
MYRLSVVAVMGCAHAAQPPELAPGAHFVCSGPPEAVAKRAAPDPAGRLVVTALADSPEGPHVRVLAENAPLPLFAVRLGEAIHYETHVAGDLDPIGVSLYAPDITIANLARMFDDSRHNPYEFVLRESNRVLWFADPSGGTERHPDVEAVRSEVIAVRTPATAEQVAAAYCASMASPRGTAAVIGDHVVISDYAGNRARIAALVRALEPERH